MSPPFNVSQGNGIKRVIGTTPQICRTGVACYRVRFGINQVPEKDFMIDWYYRSGGPSRFATSLGLITRR